MLVILKKLKIALGNRKLTTRIRIVREQIQQSKATSVNLKKCFSSAIPGHHHRSHLPMLNRDGVLHLRRGAALRRVGGVGLPRRKLLLLHHAQHHRLRRHGARGCRRPGDKC